MVEKGSTHIVADSRSSDNTIKIASRYNCQIISTEVVGIYKTLNQIIRNNVDTDWVTYINSDDLINVAWLKKNIKLLEAQNIEAIYGDLLYIDKNSEVIGSWLAISQCALGRLFFKTAMPIHQHGFIFRKTLFDRLGGFDEQFHRVGDLDFIYRAYIHGNLKYCTGPSGSFRLHTSQFTKAVSDYGHSEVKAFRSKHSLEVFSLIRYLLLLFYKVFHIKDYIYRLRLVGIKGFKFWS